MRTEIEIEGDDCFVVWINDDDEQYCHTLAEAYFWLSKRTYEAGLAELQTRINSLA
jgi:hypothetical protein